MTLRPVWLEGVNFAWLGPRRGRRWTGPSARDWSDAGLASYRRDSSASSAGRPQALRKAPALVLSERIQQRYPGLVCDLMEGCSPSPTPPQAGGLRLTRTVARPRRQAPELAADTARA